jgi:hypothetical protein
MTPPRKPQVGLQRPKAKPAGKLKEHQKKSKKLSLLYSNPIRKKLQEDPINFHPPVYNEE